MQINWTRRDLMAASRGGVHVLRRGGETGSPLSSFDHIDETLPQAADSFDVASEAPVVNCEGLRGLGRGQPPGEISDARFKVPVQSVRELRQMSGRQPGPALDLSAVGQAAIARRGEEGVEVDGERCEIL